MKALAVVLMVLCASASAAELTCTSFDDKALCKRVLAAGTDPLPGITAEQAFKKYAANEVAADQELKGKYVGISGKVLEISKDWRDGIVLTLRGGPGLMDRVQLRLYERQVSAVSAALITSRKVEELAAKLKVGQQVEAECKGAGMMLKTPMFRECLL